MSYRVLKALQNSLFVIIIMVSAFGNRFLEWHDFKGSYHSVEKDKDA